ncbi:proline dehydrogenase 1, mitochondrial-like [Pectinophora gossypiella]|uniref:proline dehydrogenase 1, mitochondrial-like n=1 Tax=Pectinophora gossypiella TaxID=13191 RepID=UPI00214F1ADA|nr:proline dehydrogenase 1, mitochondrial-like [Pectinophora gossypiella]
MRSFTVSAPAQQREPLDLTFNSSKEAFKCKYTSELVRAYLVYQICSINFIVEKNEMLMKRSRKVLGKRLFEMVMKATFYGQFVAGEDPEKIKPVIDRLSAFGVKSILDYSVEEDIPTEEAEDSEMKAMRSSLGDKREDGQLVQFHAEKSFADRRKMKPQARTYFYKNEAACEKNLEHFLMSIHAVHNATKGRGLMAVKLTALGRPQLLMQLSEVIMRARVYMEGIDGTKGNVLTHHKSQEDLIRYMSKIKDNPDVTEFLKRMTTDKKGVVHLFPWSELMDKDMNLSETFRVPDFKTGQMRRLISQISKEEEQMFRNMLRRMKILIQEAQKMDVRVMIDAEQTYFQPAISRLTMELMRQYNKEKMLVFNTYQTYLKNSYNEIVADLEQAQRQNFYWGAKCVRGAYLEQERARASAMGYDDPTNPNFDATTASFHKCLREVVTRFKGENKGRLAVMVASHNEDTVRFSIELMKEMNIKPEQKVICFGQLLGMCDHVTFPLGQAGYSAYKYLPYGPVVEVLPYLSRRANENRGFLAKVQKEKRLLLKEILRRVLSGQVFHKPVGKYTPA